jgi:hypothetical protein
VTLALLWRYRSPLAIGGLVLALLTALHMNNVRQQEIGAMRERVQKLRADSAALQTRIDSTERHYQKTVAVVTRVSGEYEDKRREIAALEATSPLSLPAPVVQALAKADTLIRGCRTLIGDGGLLIAQKDTMQHNTEEKGATQVKLGRPSKFHFLLNLAGAAAVGYLVRRHR